ncbi:hypothetical protein [Paenibacillus tundrae]|uniref:Uncharacterized protein n=1 Tax=Paenibacillus tundrae TaxID=528187 RepID=A0ABT9W680_9BACL|nr:hypothetical protein [Paenibacillus tundrae]MDQ0168759.1 hypothetical protein [Paenibacillus tundrae]
MVNVLFVILGVHTALLLVNLIVFIPVAIQSRTGIAEVTKSLGYIALIPYVPALLIIVMWIDDINDWRRK